MTQEDLKAAAEAYALENEWVKPFDKDITAAFMAGAEYMKLEMIRNLVRLKASPDDLFNRYLLTIRISEKTYIEIANKWREINLGQNNIKKQ